MLMPQFGGVPGLPAGPQPFAPQLTPEQIRQLPPQQQMQLGLDPSAIAESQAPASPGISARDKAKSMASDVLEKTKAGFQAAGTFLGGIPTGRLGLIGGMVAPAVSAIEEAQAGRPTGALGALGGGATGVALGAGVAKMLPGAYGKIAGMVLPAVGGLLGAPTGAAAAESVRQDITGKPTKGKEGEFSTQMAMAKQMGELGTTQYRNELGVQTSAIRDLSKFYSDQAYTDFQRNLPLINQMKNADLVRQQALINTQGQQYAMLGTLATAGQLAAGAQAQTGETLRTALQTNPYAGSTLQAPSMRFG